MSQNFELLRQLEAEFPFAKVIPEENPVVATPGARSNRELSKHLVTLAQTVFLSDSAKAPHAVVICGIDRNNASSEICLDLGRILAASSARPVCLVDAHLGSPRLEKLLRVDRPISFPDRSQDDYCQMAPNLWLRDLDVTGARGPVGLGRAPDLKQQIAEMVQRFGFVLIDAPGVNTGADAAIFGQFVDGMILIIEANVTRKVAALKAMQMLEGMNVRILGSVLNNRTFPIPERLYRKL